LAVLEQLASHPGQLVTRDELRRLLWPEGVHVDHERGLNYCVNRVRRALGDVAQSARFIETLPRRGYRFLASVEPVSSGAGRTAHSAVPRSNQPASPDVMLRTRRSFLVAAAALLLALQGAGDARRSQSGKRGLPSPDPVAQAAFQEGRRLLDQGPPGWRRSVGKFEEAARRDAGFALARYGLADAYLRLGEHGALASDQAFPAAREAALDALQLEERAEPLVILAALRLNYEWDWAGAERAYLQAIALDPDLKEARLSYARLLSAAGRHEEALRTIDEAERMHPGCPEVVRDAAWVHYRAHRFDESERRFRDWAALEPTLRDPHHWLALLLHLRGRPQEAIREARMVLTLADAPGPYVARFDSLPMDGAMEFYLRGSIRYLQSLAGSQWITADEIARLRAHLGEADHALADLRRAADERSPRLLPYLTDPVFDSMRSDPRFQALLRRVGAPAYERVRPG
jgi:DNA-binding winged helix-turn-helix (wHTH) protein